MNGERILTPIEGTPVRVMDQGSGPNIPIKKIQVPLTAWLSGAVAVTAVIVSLAMMGGRLVDHTANAAVHVDAQARMKGGDLAYQVDVERVRREGLDRIAAEGRKTRALLKSMTIRCTGHPGGGLTCAVDLPEPTE